MNPNLIAFIGTKIPLGEFIDQTVDFLKVNFRPIFRQISSILDFGLSSLENILLAIPALILIVLIAGLSFYLVSKRNGLFTLLGLLLIHNLGLWAATMTTLSMVLTATIVSIIFGIPLGILAAKSFTANKIIMPILDFMQTMPAFVYLIPAVSFFGMGKVTGVIATVIFAIPPAIRFTTLGINQVPTELIEAADSFGSTGIQKLVKVQLPLARPTIMAGINQTIMLSLSMVVIAAMIAAGGLGREVWNGIQRLQVGSAFEAGLAVVILAMILDKITQNIASNK